MIRPTMGTALIAATLALAAPAAGDVLAFGPDLAQAGWQVVRYPLIRPASFRPAEAAMLAVETDRAAGMLWRALGEPQRAALAACWRWRADVGVPATDLTRKGADDRVLGVYFVFGTAADAGKGPLTLLRSASVTTLVYVFGGDAPRGSVVASPHMGARGKFVVLRPADVAKGVWFAESVDIGRDYARVFGRPLPLLLGVAVSSDSDDTGTRNVAAIADIEIGHCTGRNDGGPVGNRRGDHFGGMTGSSR